MNTYILIYLDIYIFFGILFPFVRVISKDKYYGSGARAVLVRKEGSPWGFSLSLEKEILDAQRGENLKELHLNSTKLYHKLYVINGSLNRNFQNCKFFFDFLKKKSY